MKFMISVMFIFMGTVTFTSSSIGDSPAKENYIVSDQNLEKSLEEKKLNIVKHPVDQINVSDDSPNSTNEASFAERIQTWDITDQDITGQFSNGNVDKAIDWQSLRHKTTLETHGGLKPGAIIIIDTGDEVKVVDLNQAQ